MVAEDRNFPSVLSFPVEIISKCLSAFNLIIVLHFPISLRCLQIERKKPVSNSTEERPWKFATELILKMEMNDMCVCKFRHYL